MSERRYLTTGLEVRGKTGAGGTLVGHAAVFNKLSQNLGGFVEQVSPGAFAKTIVEADVRALIDHETRLVLGRNRAGTLRLSEDNIGLLAEVDLPETSYALDLARSVERGDITQMSFGFATIRDDWGFTEQDFPLRTLQEVKLYDVSPVTYPAYLDTDVGVERAYRSLAAFVDRPLEELIQAAQEGTLRSLMTPKDDAPETHPPVVDWRVKALRELDLAEVGL